MLYSVNRSRSLGRRPRDQAVHHGRRDQGQTRRHVIPKAVIEQLATGAWVAHSSKPTRGICHFLGGAFAGAAPQVLYNLLMELLAERGYTLIATPYAVTFRHIDCAVQNRLVFLDSLEELRSGRLSRVAPRDVPVFGVGHSNGALLHLLIGTQPDAPTDITSNVIISFNNRQVGDAVPIPGLLDTLPDMVRATRDVVGPLPLDPRELTQGLLGGLAAFMPSNLLDPMLVQRAMPAIDQLGSVVGEVADGTSEFTPTPSETRELVRSSYSVASTLLVRFAEDSIDQTAEMASILRSVNPIGTAELVLPGTHVTPCGSDVRWEVPYGFTPWDALGQAVKSASQVDIRRLADRVADWLDDAAAEHKKGSKLRDLDPYPGVRRALRTPTSS